MKLPLPKCEDCEFVRCADWAKSAIELNTALDNSYSKLGVGLVIFGPDAKVVYCNDQVRIHLGLPVRFVGLGFNQILNCFDKSSHAEMQRFYDHFVEVNCKKQESVFVVKGMEVLVKLEKLDQALVGSNLYGFSMFVSSLDVNGDITPDFIVQLLGLTKAEAKLTVAIVKGMTAAEYAEYNKLSIHTVYSQIKGVLAKTGVRRQAELVKLVLERFSNKNPSFFNKTVQPR